MTELEVFKILENQIYQIFEKKDKPVRVAINGIEGTGKTKFAKKLVEYLGGNRKDVYHIPIDGFHFDKEYRYRQGRDSGLGYFEDAYDEIGFINKVLISSQKEPAMITKATHNVETNQYININPIIISDNSILITDGAYLFKPIFLDYFDYLIYLKTSFEIALNRAIKRDTTKLGGLKNTAQLYRNRYHKASKIYIEKHNPEQLADCIINNTNFQDLKIENYKKTY
ncbi:hypothetical protein [Xanthomarina gelatinilytica]|uniref:hypothetical protein n=1 Tax=Xanthomarina gelatinilytica TaxID=1137281 RepID=UPI003AA7FDEE